MTYVYFKGYKAEYDYDKQDWFYVDTGESATKNPRPCKRCGHHSVKDGELEYDYCLGNLGNNVTSACCGHGIGKGYILFEDGRMFVEEKEVDDKEFEKIDEEEYGAYWIIDISNCVKTKEDFLEDDIYDIYAWEDYLEECGNVLNSKNVVKLLNELSKENKEKMGENSILKKENEALKCGNKNLKSILNDFINICNRLQANPTDKQTVSVARDMLQNMGVDLNE